MHRLHNTIIDQQHVPFGDQRPRGLKHMQWHRDTLHTAYSIYTRMYDRHP